MDDEKLEQKLISTGILDHGSAEQALIYARSKRQSFAKAIVEMGLLSETDVYSAIASLVPMPFVDPGNAKLPKAVIDRIPAKLALEQRVLPVQQKGNVLFVAIDDPDRSFVLDDLAFMVGCELKAALAAPESLQRALDRYYGEAEREAAQKTQVQTQDGDDGDAPTIRLVRKTIEKAVEMRASDIHIEPFESRVRIRYRVDGVLAEVASHPKNLQGSLISRIKIMSALDIAEKRKPQDGRIQFKAFGRDIDIRTSVLPGNHGETIVMRLLDKEQSLISLETLGFGGEDRATFGRLLKRPNGIFLVTGPTGSGKTTTLYAALRELNKPDVKIITAEDPVEYHLTGINQSQVKQQIGLTFARILRAMLRQAPNIILVGEIRDTETAEIAIQAALTGHLVFSTLHTNDAPSALTRLIDMGVKPFLVAASIQAVLAQRLIRLLCVACKEAYEPSISELESIGLSKDMLRGATVYRPKGCETCEGKGYFGRHGIFELMVMDEELREMTFRRESTMAVRHYAENSTGMSTLLKDGARKVSEGSTSIEEIFRVVATG